MKFMILFLLLPLTTFATNYSCDGNKTIVQITDATLQVFEKEFISGPRSRGSILLTHEVGFPVELKRSSDGFRETFSNDDFELVMKENHALLTRTNLNFLFEKSYFCSVIVPQPAVRRDPPGYRQHCRPHSCP